MRDMEMVMAATDAKVLFGSNAKRAKITYRRLARAVHPDMFQSEDDKNQASSAFRRLTDLWDEWTARENGSSKTGNGVNGARKPDEDTITTPTRTYTVDSRPTGDPFFARLDVTYDAGHEAASVLIASSPGNADLADNHVTQLRHLGTEVPEQFRGFYPKVVETFQYADGSTARRGIVQSRVEGFSPFTKILEVYPSGIVGRDMGWIFRRMLTAVGNAHDAGIIHGAVSLDSLLIHPEQHGLMLTDWQYSVPVDGTLRAVPKALRDDYPDTALSGDPVNHSLDINLCAKVALRLLAADQPSAMRTFFKVCSNPKTLSASVLLREFDILLARLYGPPKFHPFTLNP